MNRIAGALLLVTLLFGVASQAAAQVLSTPFVWIEADRYASATIAPQVSGWGRKELLSEEKWLQISIDADKIETTLPAGGAALRYPFQIAAPAVYEVWNRIGYEFARSPFLWRIDNGPWQRVNPDARTIELQTIETWNEVGWLRLGTSELGPGAHTLDIQLPRTTDDQGKPQRILYASDALCLYAGTWHPNGKFRPNESGRDARDDAAAAHRFALPEASAGGERATIPLAGDWEVCRGDEDLPPADIAVPMDDFPEQPHWKAIPVPSDKNAARPDLVFAHRLWYRTHVRVPASHAGRSFFLTFPRNNLNTTVLVNGVPCGFQKSPNVAFSLDISRGIKIGEDNEILVGIRDAWYSYSNSPTDPLKLRRAFNLPLSVVGNGFQDLAYPIWHAWESGIVQTPTLTSAGAVYASDVFVQPKVTPAKYLTVDVRLSNPGRTAVSATFTAMEAIDERTGKVARAWPLENKTIALAANTAQVTTLQVLWPDAKLWWPEPNPALYRLRLTIRSGEQRDISETRFGFREWGARGKDFLLNGQIWHGWADLNAGSDPKSWLANYRKTNQRFMRLSGYAQGGSTWLGLTPSEALDLFDQQGVVVRRSGDLDGEAIGYMAIENDPELQKRFGSPIKMELMQNWRDQMVAQVRAERNHPSIHVWSLENEWLYINCINLYGDKMDLFEQAVQACGDAVAAVDPTRLWMTDGGGAGKANRFPIHGDHYVFDENSPRYPDIAYQANPTGGGRGRWVWDEKRPRYIGEDFFATGINPADYAAIGGEATFGGKAAAMPTAGQIQRQLTEGYRWAGYGAWHLWLGSESATNQYGANADIALFIRERDTAFGSGRTVQRTGRLFNDAFHHGGMLTYTWRASVGPTQTVGAGSATVTVPAGTSRNLSLTFTLPKVTKRTAGALTLSVLSGGKEVFKDVRPFSVLPEPRIASTPASAQLARAGNTAAPSPFVYDPSGRLRGLGTSVASLAKLPSPTTRPVLVIAPDALSDAESTAPTLAAFAAGGGRVIVLEQRYPLRFQALPLQVESTDRAGSRAFAEDPEHPALAGLDSADLADWRTDEPIFRNAYAKPTGGGRSLIQGGPRLQYSALLEAPVGDGLLVLCQLAVGRNLERAAPARTLLANLVTYARGYRQTFRPTATVATAGAPLSQALQAIGVTTSRAAEPLEALQPGGLAIIEATPANLKTLVGAKERVDAFTRSGGYLLLHGLTPDGLTDYNHLVGVEHLIRPFRREKLGLAPTNRSRLAAGLTAADVVMLSGERIFPWTSDEYLAADIFSFVVDYDEIARFATLPEPAYFGLSDATNDHNPLNMYNGFTTSDGWVFAFMQWAGSGPPKAIPLQFARPQTIREIEWTGNALYDPTTRIALTFDGKETLTLSVQPTNAPQTLAIQPPRTASTVALQIVAWRPDKPEQPLVGIDNIRLKATRPASFARTVRPLTDVGGLMDYPAPSGGGGIALCNLLFQEREAVPINAQKKRAILATLLRNLRAPFAGARTVVAGAANLGYEPIDIGKRATAYRNERGWFGDPKQTFAALPTGRQRFADVPFTIYDFPTSPVPTAVVLGGPNVPGNLPDAVRGIAVRQKADALFFLQTARIDQPIQEWERREKKRFELARYVITYTDGRSVTVPLFQDEDLADYRQEKPAALPGALLGWTRLYDGTNRSATAWVKPWTNPSPDVEIQEIGLEYGPDRRGVPALLAITAARAR
jgi:beta-galactosidase